MDPGTDALSRCTNVVEGHGKGGICPQVLSMSSFKVRQAFRRLRLLADDDAVPEKIPAPEPKAIAPASGYRKPTIPQDFDCFQTSEKARDFTYVPEDVHHVVGVRTSEYR